MCDWSLGTHKFCAFNFILKIGCDSAAYEDDATSRPHGKGKATEEDEEYLEEDDDEDNDDGDDGDHEDDDDYEDE